MWTYLYDQFCFKASCKVLKSPRPWAKSLHFQPLWNLVTISWRGRDITCLDAPPVNVCDNVSCTMKLTSELRRLRTNWGPDFLDRSCPHSCREDTRFPDFTMRKRKVHIPTSLNRLKMENSNTPTPQALPGCEHCPPLPLPQILRHKTPCECSCDNCSGRNPFSSHKAACPPQLAVVLGNQRRSGHAGLGEGDQPVFKGCHCPGPIQSGQDGDGEAPGLRGRSKVTGHPASPVPSLSLSWGGCVWDPGVALTAHRPPTPSSPTILTPPKPPGQDNPGAKDSDSERRASKWRRKRGILVKTEDKVTGTSTWSSGLQLRRLFWLGIRSGQSEDS